MHGFRMFHSFGGDIGWSSDFILLERLSVDYGKKRKLEFTVYSVLHVSIAVVGPYNSILAKQTTVAKCLGRLIPFDRSFFAFVIPPTGFTIIAFPEI
jgi:hypothetical protein